MLDITMACAGATTAGSDSREVSRRSCIQKAINDAHELGLLSDAERATASMMASYIRDDFERPVCAVEVQRIARDRCRDVSSIRRHVTAMIRAGIVDNETAGNGLRGAFYGGAVVMGISFAPALERREQLWADVRCKREAEGRLLGLRRLISKARRKLRAVCEEVQDTDTLDWLMSLPRRYGKLDADQLNDLVHQCESKIEALIQAASTEQSHTDDPIAGRAKISDGPRKITRPFTVTERDNNNIKSTGAAGFSAENYDPATSIDLAKVIQASPPEWREWIAAYHEEPRLMGWAGFVLVAKSYFHQAGGDEATWQKIISRAGERVAAVLCLLATNNPEVRDVSRWMLSMTTRAREARFNWGTPLFLMQRKYRKLPA